MKKFLFSSLSAIALGMTISGFAMGAPAMPFSASVDASHDSVPIALQNLEKSGVDIVYIGNQGGVAGYLLRSADGKLETMYLWPDQHDMVTGVEFDADGNNVTSVQIADMQHRFEALHANSAPAYLSNRMVDGAMAETDPNDIPVFADLIKKDKIFPMVRHNPDSPLGFVLEKKEGSKTIHQDVYVTPDGHYMIAGRRFAVSQKGVFSMPAVSIASSEKVKPLAAAPINMKEAEKSPKKAVEAHNGLPLPPPPEPAIPGHTSSSSFANGINGPVPVQQDIPRKLFYDHVKGSAWFGIGNSKAPIVWFVADPAANLSRQAWQVLAPLIKANRIAVKIILVDGSALSEKMNLAILSSHDPVKLWMEAMAGQKLDAPRSGTPEWRRAVDWLNYNWKFAHGTDITATPVLAYIGRDHRFHSAQEPADVKLFLKDV